MVLMLIALLVQAQETWEYRAGVRGFVNPATMEQKSPDELFAYGEKLFNDKEPSRAHAVFQAIADRLPADSPAEQSLRERGLFAAARCAYTALDFLSAYAEFAAFLARFPDSDLAPGPQGARYFLCQSAFNLAQVGQKESVLGVPLYRSSKNGVDLLKKALVRFPREPFSDDFYLALGEFLLQQGKLDEAETEFKFILTPGQYDRTNSAPRAQLLLARIFLQRFDGVEYDVKMLADAKREYEKFISAWSRAKGDAKTLLALDLSDAALQKMLDEAAAGIAGINERLAEKQWTMAQYYFHHGKESAARVYLKAILADYPATTWAAKAKELLEETGK